MGQPYSAKVFLLTKLANTIHFSCKSHNLSPLEFDKVISEFNEDTEPHLILYYLRISEAPLLPLSTLYHWYFLLQLHQPSQVLKMFSIFTPTKSSLGPTRKTKDYEELSCKLNDATKQLCNLLLSEEDCKHLYNTIDYCMSQISTFAIHVSPSQQLATAPEPDNAAKGQNDPLATPVVNQNPNMLLDLLNPATNLAYWL